MRNQGQWTKYIKELYKKFLDDLNDLWDNNTCSYCDCEDKIYKLIKKWDNYEKIIKNA